MEIYSPKAQKADNFKKNTIRKNEGIMINSKSTLTSPTIIFEFDEEPAINKTPKQSFVTSMFDYMKLRFYSRMKVFFDFEDRIKEEAESWHK